MSSPAQVNLLPLSPLRYLRVSRRFVFVKESMPGLVGTTAALIPHGGHLPDVMFYTQHNHA